MIRPPKSLNISISNKPEEIQRVYDIGRNEGLKCLGAVRDYLS